MSRELVERAMHGSRDAFEMLADRSFARLVGAAHLILRDQGWAEDAAQDALLRAWRDLPSLRDPDRYDAWQHRLLVRSCQDQLRRRRHELRELELDPRQGPGVNSAEARLADRDELQRALDHLTVEQRTVVTLRYYLELTDTEIAAATGLPLGTVKSRMSRSLDALRAALASEARRSRPLAQERSA